MHALVLSKLVMYLFTFRFSKRSINDRAESTIEVKNTQKK
jgi:hypothetical protein